MRVLLVDGYNVLHQWPELASLMHKGRLEDARRQLISLLGHYAATSGTEVTVVFDSKRNGHGERELIDGVIVRYSTRDQSADHVIERIAFAATRHGPATDVIVATSDRLQRDLVVAMGVGVISSPALRDEVLRATGDTGTQIARRQQVADMHNRLEDRLDPAARAALEEIRRGTTPST